MTPELILYIINMCYPGTRAGECTLWMFDCANQSTTVNEMTLENCSEQLPNELEPEDALQYNLQNVQ